MPLTGLLGRNGVSQVLRQNIDDLLFLINGTPQVLELTVDRQVHLIQGPGTFDWARGTDAVVWNMRVQPCRTTDARFRSYR